MKLLYPLAARRHIGTDATGPSYLIQCCHNGRSSSRGNIKVLHSPWSISGFAPVHFVA